MKWMAVLALAGVLVSPEGEAATNLFRVGVPWAPGSKGLADLQAAARDLAHETAGRVQVKFVEQHDLDAGPAPCAGGLLAGPYLARYSPAAVIYSLPLLFRSSGEVARVRSWMDGRITAELGERGWETLAQMDLGFAYLHARMPVETVDRLKSVRLWVPPAEPEALREAESYGVALVPLEASQVRDALRAGTVDAAIVPPLGAILLQWHVEIQSVSDEPFLDLPGAVVFRKEALAALDEADRAALREELARAFAAAVDDLRGKEQESLDVLVQNGVARRPFGTTPEQRAAWEAWAAGVADRLAAAGRVPADGVAQARRTLAEFRAEP